MLVIDAVLFGRAAEAIAIAAKSAKDEDGLRLFVDVDFGRLDAAVMGALVNVIGRAPMRLSDEAVIPGGFLHPSDASRNMEGRL